MKDIEAAAHAALGIRNGSYLWIKEEIDEVIVELQKLGDRDPIFIGPDEIEAGAFERADDELCDLLGVLLMFAQSDRGRRALIRHELKVINRGRCSLMEEWSDLLSEIYAITALGTSR